MTTAAATRQQYWSFRKTPAVVTVANTWYDYSLSPGNPAPQYYAAAPLVAQALRFSADGGFKHGASVAPLTKYLLEALTIITGAGGCNQQLTLCDYLLFYPFCDMGTVDPQPMTNTQTLPRSTDGAGVQIMAVLVAPHALVGDSFAVTYTNQDGVAGRVTPLHVMQTATSINGAILTTQGAGADRLGPFLALQGTDTGVRSIESVQCTAGTDVGLFTLVLIKPLASWPIIDITAPVERNFAHDAGLRLPVIDDDAYLNLLGCPSGSISGVTFTGALTFTWN